jgi:hypothetical protein
LTGPSRGLIIAVAQGATAVSLTLVLSTTFKKGITKCQEKLPEANS